MKKCAWCLTHPLLETYHDTQWGVPVFDDKKHFEHLFLETMQAGLSWLTILKKYDAFANAFANFDPSAIANFTQTRQEKLLQNPGIIRHRQKISAAVNNAKRFLALQKECGSFSDFLWNFTDHKIINHKINDPKNIPAQTALSEEISKCLKKQGFAFVGPVTIYAHLQSVGIINDHETSCFRHKKISLPS